MSLDATVVAIHVVKGRDSVVAVGNQRGCLETGRGRKGQIPNEFSAIEHEEKGYLAELLHETAEPR